MRVLKYAMAGNRTRIDCLEGNHDNHYTTIASCRTRLAQLNVLYIWKNWQLATANSIENK